MLHLHIFTKLQIYNLITDGGTYGPLHITQHCLLVAIASRKSPYQMMLTTCPHLLLICYQRKRPPKGKSKGPAVCMLTLSHSEWLLLGCASAPIAQYFLFANYKF
jgi:hypothetical protein